MESQATPPFNPPNGGSQNSGGQPIAWPPLSPVVPGGNYPPPVTPGPYPPGQNPAGPGGPGPSGGNPGGPSDAADLQAWVQKLKALAGSCAAVDAEVARQIGALAGRLESMPTMLAFGGHFKAGKSTLLNALLGRPLLPVSGLPETGALCFLRAGSDDAARVIDVEGGTRSIECTTAAIQREVTLTDASGKRRTQAHAVDRLELTLSSSTLGPYACWVDSPGINDTTEMTECARRAATESDVLLWVLNTRQFLSITEVEFLSDHITARGPHAVVLLVNAFLESDTLEAWGTFLRGQLEAHRERVRDRAADMAFPPEVVPDIIVVSGRALSTIRADWSTAFGRPALIGLMASLSSGERPRIRRARLGRATAELTYLAAESRDQLELDRAAVDEHRQQHHQERKNRLETVQQRRGEFRSEVEAALDAFGADWRKRAAWCGETAVNALPPPGAPFDGKSCEHALNMSLREQMVMASGSLLQNLAGVAQHCGYQPLDAAHAAQLQTLLVPLFWPVYVPYPANNAVGVRAGAANLLAGKFPGAAPVSAPAPGGPLQSALAEVIRANTRTGATTAAAMTGNLRPLLLAFVLEHCSTPHDEEMRWAVPQTGFSGGQMISTGAMIDTRAVDDPAPEWVYGWERRGQFSCRQNGLRAGNVYTVRLHFAETVWYEVGKRRFHVGIHGRWVLTDYDIFARAGGKNRAVIEEFKAIADAAGSITLNFAIGSADQPQVCAVEIVPDEAASPLRLLKRKVRRRTELMEHLEALAGEAQELLHRAEAPTP